MTRPRHSPANFVAGDVQIPDNFDDFERSSAREAKRKDCMAVEAVLRKPFSVCISL